ncbi:MAG: hypothetical protein IJ181_10020 [Acidaminococcaceae bacterium]|nr:hypothetical protein [Acidaminococcaceae bacterium]
MTAAEKKATAQAAEFRQLLTQMNPEQLDRLRDAMQELITQHTTTPSAHSKEGGAAQ